MILYRVLNKYELDKLNGLNFSNTTNTLYGNNTFKYEKNVEYMHFFKYAQHAQKYKEKFGVCIAKLDIPEEIIDQYGFGFYGNQGELAPECIIKKCNFDKKFIIDIENNIKKEWAIVNDSQITYDELYNKLLKVLETKLNEERKFEYFNIYVSKKVNVKEIDNILLQYLDKEKRSTR